MQDDDAGTSYSGSREVNGYFIVAEGVIFWLLQLPLAAKGNRVHSGRKGFIVHIA